MGTLSALEEDISVGKVQVGRVRTYSHGDLLKVEQPSKGLQYPSWTTIRQRLSFLHPTSLGKCEPSGRNGIYKKEHETSLIFCLLFFPNYLYYTVHLIVPAHYVCSFHSSCFPILPLPFISMCHSSGALLIFLLSPYFPVFPNHHNSLLCLKQTIPTTITKSFLPPSENNTYMESPILMQLARSGYDLNIFQNVNSTPEKKGNFVVNYKDIYAPFSKE